VRIAVIGGGIAGLTAASRLSPRHEVTLFEKSGRVGGNAYSVRTREGFDVDIAVAAFGRAGYSNFYALLSELGVETAMCLTSYASFHDLERQTGTYLTATLAGLVAQRFDALRPGKLWRLSKLISGLHQAQQLRLEGRLDGKTMRDLLAMVPDLSGDARTVLLGSLCLLSSMNLEELLDAPARFFMEKLAHHHDFISPKAFYSVRAIKRGTQAYVQALASKLEGHLELNAAVSSIRRTPQEVTVRLATGEVRSFDRLILACPAPQALALLDDPTADERRLLGAWSYKAGQVVLHRDLSHLPARALIQAYTVLYRKTPDGELANVSINGALWHEPQASSTCDYVSTQYPNFDIDPALVELETVLHTPVFDFASVATTAQLPRLQGVRGTAFCGSYFGFGLHEDAVTSALAAARAVDATP
jgi:predicted NAD/FAD-binding protein